MVEIIGDNAHAQFLGPQYAFTLVVEALDVGQI